jgi:hypothetical protein
MRGYAGGQIWPRHASPGRSTPPLYSLSAMPQLNIQPSLPSPRPLLSKTPSIFDIFVFAAFLSWYTDELSGTRVPYGRTVLLWGCRSEFQDYDV